MKNSGVSGTVSTSGSLKPGKDNGTSTGTGGIGKRTNLPDLLKDSQTITEKSEGGKYN